MAYEMFSGALLALIIVLSIWEMIWKGVGMWKSARNDQLGWYVFILILNTAGILPIIYLLFFQRKPFVAKATPKKTAKKKRK